ncbi:L-lysine exporter family protein LysE/ArgO [Desulfobaculum xiamenense]|uniref:L-lysine exporter family protein LysE/ArgO n=2 Tax=Desulfobaculum xiamenense TaxID=995050 RepID=A0A846QKU2_9BACT|nr:L-lysine exporter family protein LysE/ArgO [Desulfobaculum xiamenense]
MQIALLCSMCDALLITIGVSGVGTLVVQNPGLASFAAWGGAAFLAWYGFGSLRSAFSGAAMDLEEGQARSLRSVLLATLGVTFLNPHTYLDTIVLLGSIGGQFPGHGRFLFGAGAVSASLIWFFTLSFGARLLAPLFRNPKAWQVLDLIICSIMWAIAASLIRGQLAA